MLYRFRLDVTLHTDLSQPGMYNMLAVMLLFRVTSLRCISCSQLHALNSREPVSCHAMCDGAAPFHACSSCTCACPMSHARTSRHVTSRHMLIRTCSHARHRPHRSAGTYHRLWRCARNHQSSHAGTGRYETDGGELAAGCVCRYMSCHVMSCHAMPRQR